MGHPRWEFIKDFKKKRKKTRFRSRKRERKQDLDQAIVQEIKTKFLLTFFFYKFPTLFVEWQLDSANYNSINNNDMILHRLHIYTWHLRWACQHKGERIFVDSNNTWCTILFRRQVTSTDSFVRPSVLPVSSLSVPISTFFLRMQSISVLSIASIVCDCKVSYVNTIRFHLFRSSHYIETEVSTKENRHNQEYLFSF